MTVGWDEWYEKATTYDTGFDYRQFFSERDYGPEDLEELAETVLTTLQFLGYEQNGGREIPDDFSDFKRPLTPMRGLVKPDSYSQEYINADEVPDEYRVFSLHEEPIWMQKDSSKKVGVAIPSLDSESALSLFYELNFQLQESGEHFRDRYEENPEFFEMGVARQRELLDVARAMDDNDGRVPDEEAPITDFYEYIEENPDMWQDFVESEIRKVEESKPEESELKGWREEANEVGASADQKMSIGSFNQIKPDPDLKLDLFTIRSNSRTDIDEIREDIHIANEAYDQIVSRNPLI